jgi:general secretion pathway protein D
MKIKILILLTIFLAAPFILRAQSNDEMIQPGTIDFQGVDAAQVLDVYAKLVNRTVLRAALPGAQIILKTQTPLTRIEAIQALEAVLALNGIAVINIGDKFVKALPVGDANSAGAEFNDTSAGNLPNLGSYVTHIVQLHYVKPSEMIPIISPFAKLANSILAIDSNGILVLRDNAENVKRMLEMIAQVDINVPAEYISAVIPIRYAKVDDIASALNSLGNGGSGATVSIGSSPANTPISGFGANRSAQGTTSGFGGNSTSGYQSGIGGGSSGGAYGTRSTAVGGATTPNGTPAGGTTFQQRLNSILNRASGASGGQQDQIQLFGQTKIIPNESSSSLLIFATRSDMMVITNIIAQLDVPLAQVLIEAVIMDVNLGHTFQFGVSAVQNPTKLSPGGSVIGGGGVNNGNPFIQFMQSFTTNFGSGLGTNLISSVSSAFSASGATNAIFGNNLAGGFSYFGNIGPTWDVALSAAQSDDNASIIQRPRIQTSQAKPAQFFVGETVPYVTGNTYGGAYGNSSSYSQLSVGVELDVTPFINPDGLVVMDIQQEIDDLDGSTAIQGVGDVPNTIKRTLNAEIAVRDRDTVMMGGFIKSNKSHTQSGVPFLSDIPILGNLFKQRTDTKNREELIVMIRPTVLQTPEIAARQTIKEQQRLPGISAAAAEEAASERKLIDAERKREQSKFNKTKQYDGFYEIEPEGTSTNVIEPASAILEHTETNAMISTPADDAAAAQERSRQAVQEKMHNLDSTTNAPQ